MTRESTVAPTLVRLGLELGLGLGYGLWLWLWLGIGLGLAPTLTLTLAPQPPQRMLVWLSDSSASLPAARATSGGSAPSSSSMAGRWLE